MTQAANLAALGSNVNSSGQTSLTAGVSGILPSTNGGTATASGVTGFKNRLINGSMVLDQRNVGASVTPSGDAYTLDRWWANMSTGSKFSVQQVSDAPAGFNNSLKVTSTSAYSVGAGDYFWIAQKIEGYNISDLNFGTVNAKTFTLSFWAKSSLTGTFGVVFINGAENRNYATTYTISSANTWEQKTITVAGDQSGTWVGSSNGVGLKINFEIGIGSNYYGSLNTWTTGSYGSSGQTNVVSTNGATWQITGCQLEVGSSATTFDTRPYTTELQLCQRYYEKAFNQGTVPANGISGGNFTHYTFNAYASNTGWFNAIWYKVIKRTAPTITYYNNLESSGGKWGYYNGAWNTFSTTGSDWGSDFSFGPAASASGFTAGQCWPASGSWTADAEL